VGTSCRLGDGVRNPSCSRGSGNFDAEIDEAIDLLVQRQPDIFDLRNDIGNANFYIRSVGRFIVGVVENLEAQGLCATFDGEEIQVKNTNSFSDQYDVLLTTGHVRRPPTAYRSTCSPSAFPLPTGQPGQVPGCSLPGSRELACGREDASQYLADVEAAMDQVIREKPDLFDVNDTQPGTNFVKVINVDGYLAEMVRVVSGKGYCARWDGEEIQVKKENRFNEQIDILTANDYTRRGEGAYRSSCYPAAF